MLARGLKPCQIATETGCCVRVIYNWVYTWHDLGMAGLLGGQSLTMTPEMITTAVEATCAESLTLARLAPYNEAGFAEKSALLDKIKAGTRSGHHPG